MAYNRNNVILFGVGGAAIALALIIIFLPVRVEVGLNPTVALNEISEYGFQIIKISEAQTSVVHLNITLDNFEIRKTDGEWFEIDIERGSTSFDLLLDREIFIVTEIENLDIGNYDAIRFQVVRGLEFTNATLGTGEILAVDVPHFKVAYLTSIFAINEGTDSLFLELHTGSGILSNYMLPDIHMSIGAMKIEVIVSET